MDASACQPAYCFIFSSRCWSGRLANLATSQFLVLCPVDPGELAAVVLAPPGAVSCSTAKCGCTVWTPSGINTAGCQYFPGNYKPGAPGRAKVALATVEVHITVQNMTFPRSTDFPRRIPDPAGRRAPRHWIRGCDTRSVAWQRGGSGRKRKFSDPAADCARLRSGGDRGQPPCRFETELRKGDVR